MRFTLVELLIVIAIITILAGFLLPALQKSIYSAKKISCGNNLKQLGTGLFTYASDYRRYYPSHGLVPRTNGPLVGRLRAYDLDYHTSHDLTPLTDPYFGGNTLDAVTCPLAVKPLRNLKSNYALWFDLNARGGIRTEDAVDAPDLLSRSKMLMKVGQTFTYKVSSPANDVKKFNTLANDNLMRGLKDAESTVPFNREIKTNHFSPGSYYHLGVGSFGNDNWFWKGLLGAEANYLKNDGSLKGYRLGVPNSIWASSFDGWYWKENQDNSHFLPEDHAAD